MENQSIDFSASIGSLALSFVAMVAATILGVMSWRRSGLSKAVARLELLRLLIIGLVVLLLNQPEWTAEYDPEVKPSVVVIYDDSPSMQTVDVLTASAGDGQAVSRELAVSEFVDQATWGRLIDRFNVLIEPLGSSLKGGGSDDGDALVEAGLTNLSQPLVDAMEERDSLAAVVMISDGDWNEGDPPVEIASRMRTRDVPVFTVAIGSVTKLPDVELVSADVPTFGAVGKPIRIPLSIDSSLPREIVVNAQVSFSNGETISKDIRIAPMGRTFDSILWTPEEIGDYELTVKLPVNSAEKIDSNNELVAPIAIRQEQLKVLVVESLPRWEYRYLRNALSRDPGVEVSCLLFHPRLEKVGGGSQDYIKVFPEALEDLSEYDVVFLGDVGLDDGQLTAEQCDLVKGLVEFQASGLVLMPGFQGRQFSLLETGLNELYPVVLDADQPGGWGARVPGHFELTQRGRNSLLTKLADTAEENEVVWEGLPGFQWYAPVVRSKAGSEVLAVHQDMSNQSGRLPLLVTRPYGAGKVLFMGTDGAWRWRKGVEDKYHYRFWGQVVRWMAYQRNMAKGETMRLFYTPDQPRIRQTINFNAHVMDDSGEPLQDGLVSALITSPSGVSDNVQMRSEGERWGVFQGRYSANEPGQHRVILSCSGTSSELQSTFFVQGDLSEPVGRPARPEVLEEISRVSRGEFVAPNEVNSLLEAISELPMPSSVERRFQIWAHPLAAGILVFLLGLFWILRKAAGLI